MTGVGQTYVIAEAGVNHNGSLDRAVQMVDAAAEAGVDAVKCQSFSAGKLASLHAPKADYQIASTGSDDTQYKMLKELELSPDAHFGLAERCAGHGIEFLSSPFDIDSLRFLVEDMDVRRLKLGSGEITNGPLLLEAARSGKPLILSTGMCTLGDVEAALQVLAYGYTNSAPPRSCAVFRAAYSSEDGRAALSRNVILLHCTTEYPTPPSDVNLRAMDTLREAFGLPVGLSDHTQGVAAAVAAVAREACVLEKHFTLDRSLPGPDHRASLEPDELRALVRDVRTVEQALGSRFKAASPSEAKNEPIARKSLVAAQRIAAGEPFTETNLTAKRPGNGLSPLLYWDYLGRRAQRSYQVDEPIDP